MRAHPLIDARLAGSHIGAALLSVALLAAWIGAAVFFSAIVARAAFRVLPTRALAGALVGDTLPALFLAGIIVGVVVALLAFREPQGAGGRILRLASSLGVAVLCALARFGIGARIDRLRASLPVELDALPSSDAARVAFGRLHALSVLALGLAVVLALVALIVLWRHITLLARMSQLPVAR